MTASWPANCARVRALLNWQATLDPVELSRELGVASGVVSDALRVLGASGLVGFDVLDSRHYFHRVLPLIYP